MYFVLHCALGRGPASLGEKILEGKETNLVTPSQAASQQAKAKVAFDDLAVPEAVALIVVWSLLRLNQGKFTLVPTDSYLELEDNYVRIFHD